MKKIFFLMVLFVAILLLFFFLAPIESKEFEVKVLVQNLDTPWGIDFLSDGRMIFTERPGKVSIFDRGEVKVVGNIKVSEISESGLLGIAVDPEFDKNHFIYLYYTHEKGNRVSRFVLNEKLEKEFVLLDNIPSAMFHDGGRIKFGPDGKLYITTGDATNPSSAQDLDSLAGKILRMNKDGTIPEDNPFENYVYSYGHRNPQGIAWHPQSGELYASEHGPARNDELNIIVKGENYGWPLVECDEISDEYIKSIRCYSEFTLAPSGIAFYKNDLYIAGLRGNQLRRIVFDKDYKTVISEEALFSSLGRVREVVEHDGYLYVATSNKDGRGIPKPADDKIIKITLRKEEVPLTLLGETVYVENAKSNTISVIDVSINKVVRNIIVGNAPHDLKLSSDQELLYTTDIDSGTISIINTTTNTLVDRIKTEVKVHGIAILNDTLYVGDVYGGRVLVIKNKTIIDKIKVGSGPEYLGIRPDGKIMYVANLWSPISVVDLEQKKVIKEVDSGKIPHGLSFSKDGTSLYIVNMKSNTLSIIDAINHEIIKTIKVGNNPEYVALSPDESFAYVTNLEDDTVSVVDITTLEIINTIKVGDGPHGIVFTTNGKFAYVSNMNSNDVSVIDTEKKEIAATIAVGEEPHQLVIKKPIVKIITDSSAINVFVEIADEPEERIKGLMFRERLEKDAGMLFIFEDEQTRNFWMKNT